MRRDTIIKGASFTGTSDLTIVAPIRKGFVPSLDAVTYKTRVKRVLKTLHLGRQTAHEYEFARVLSDAVERVGRIHSIRIAIMEPEDKVLLAVTFDGSWESYIRVIWQKVSRSLDLIFCNTEDYVTGWEHSFEEWGVWLRKRQAESSFLYSPPGLTYQDTVYLRTFERRLRRDGNADLDATRIHIPTAEEISDQMCKDGTDLSNAGQSQPVQPVQASRPAFRQGMRGLAGLYRLADQHLPATGDDAVLHRAATELLREFRPMLSNPAKYQEAITRAETRFKDALDWFRDTPTSDRGIPRLPDEVSANGMSDVQGGIVDGYLNTSEGCLVLLSADTPLALAGFLQKSKPTSATDAIGVEGVAINIALTTEGLRIAGLTDDEFAALPAEFVQGMERRAGMLGDLRVNHPQRWSRPALNWSQGIAASDVAQDDPSPRANLAAVHLVLQLRLCNSTASKVDARTRLLQIATQMVDAVPGVQALSIQWMHRLPAANGTGTREHFGFLDSQSQPVYNKVEAGGKYANQVHLGEVLLGRDNAADTAPVPLSSAAIAGHSDPRAMQLRNDTLSLLHNGSFLVIRKLRQDIGALEIALDEAVDAALPIPATATPDELTARTDYRILLQAKMMGRWPEASATPGEALVSTLGKNDNDFNFNNDKAGSLCPFHAHIRRANPRDTSVPEPPGARPARLFRRGMSYGPLHDTTASGTAKDISLAQERGLVFMAYNANIGEQFEVIQRWLTGGNSSGSYSGQSDPFLGLAEPGRQRFFRFEHANQTVRMHLDGSDAMHEEPRPMVRLEWGMYLFTPSLSAIQTLIDRAKDTGKPFAKSWSEELGEQEIARLRRVAAIEGELAAFDAWKAALEDPATAADFTAASIWAAIRKNHGGVLDTPLGVLVASRELVDEVLLDKRSNLTATGYLPRMQRSFGGLYLGLDAGQIEGVYELESADVNAAIMGLVANPADCKLVVAEAAKLTKYGLDVLARTAAGYAALDCETHWEVTFDAREVIDGLLAQFCEKWFGLSEDGSYLQKSGVRWNWKLDEPPCYPGHFMAPSRYTFQPHPGPEVEKIGAQHGAALRVAITKYLEACRVGPPEVMAKAKDILSKAKVAQAILGSAAAKADPGYPARTLAGVLMGFLPTTDGNMRRVLNEWLNEGTLWSLRAQFAITRPTDAVALGALTGQIHKKFGQAMQLRAAPELLWRTAATSHTIGKAGADQVAVRPGQIVIASLISATHQCLELGDSSLDYAFGGRRQEPPTNAHPTHACPGYGPATAVMLGFFQGLVESGQALRAGPGPLSFYMDGYAALQPGCEASASSTLEMLADGQPEADAANFTALRVAAIPLLVIGDSWLTDLGDFLYPASLASRLRRLGYRLDNSSESQNFRDFGKQLAQIADSTLLAEIGQYLADLQGTSGLPKSILIGAGGNDLVDPATRPESTKLYGMLNANAANANAALIEQKVQSFIDVTLFNHYVALLDVVTATTVASIPILIHGYDHPIPDGKKFEGVLGLGQRGPWLKSVFDAKNIPMSISRDVMKTLINRLNDMLIRLETRYHGRVYHLKLTETLANQPEFEQKWRTYWDNELHATAVGFDALAGVVKNKLESLGIR